MCTGFSTHWKVIAEGVAAFFRRAEAGFEDQAAFACELKTTLGILGKRMAEEEQTLHPMLRKLLSRPPPMG